MAAKEKKKRTPGRNGPTMNQKRTFGFIQEQIASGKKINLSAAARKAGYAPSTVTQSSRVIGESDGWKELIATFDDTPYMARLNNIALKSESEATSLRAIEMVMKLKDRFPAGKLKTTEYEDEVNALKADVKVIE